MTKNRKSRSRQYRPMPNANVPLIDPSRQQQAAASQQAAIGQKIENLAAQIYTNSLPELYDIDPDRLEQMCQVIADRSIDCSIILAKSLWGVDVRRGMSKDQHEETMNQRQQNAPKPIIE